MPKTETPIRLSDVLVIPRGRKTEVQRRLEALAQAILDSDEPYAIFRDLAEELDSAANTFQSMSN